MQGISACAQCIEEAGFDATFVTDHPVPESAWLAKGGHHTLDPFVALSFVASCTLSLKVMTNILVLPYRNPFLVAKSVASLDRLSNGRSIIGLGAGYLEGEFGALGSQLASRGKEMEEALRAMKLAWKGGSFSFQGSDFAATGNTALPKPQQQPHPPLWMGGNSTAAMRRAAQYCDGWLPFPVTEKYSRRVRTRALADIDSLAAAIADLRDMERDFARSKPLDICMAPFGLDMHSSTNPDSKKLVAQLVQLRELGVTWISLSLSCDSVSHYQQRVEWFSQEVLKPLQ
jgi:probable F420-dependent oxidoreductase